MTVGDIYTLNPLRREIDVLIPLEGVTLEGFLSLPKHAKGLIICAHASDAGRFLPRNQQVAKALADQRFGTLLVDLLMPAEEAASDMAGSALNIELLAKRLESIVYWAGSHAKLGNKPIGLLGSAAGAAAALAVAARQPDIIQAVVCRSGKTDLALSYLEKIDSPTLLIIGGNDREMLACNERALVKLNMQSRLEIILHATHLFEEPGALEEMIKLAVAWFTHHLHERKKHYANLKKSEA